MCDLVSDLELARPLLQRLFRLLALRDVDKRHYRSDDFAPRLHRIGPVFRWEAPPVGAPEDLVVDVNPFSIPEGLVDPALVRGVWLSTGSRVVDQVMHVLSV